LIKFGMQPKPDGTGKYILSLPMRRNTVLPVISCQDIGLCAAGVFKKPELIDQTIGIVGDFVTGPQLAAAIAAERRLVVEYQPITAGEYRELGFPGAKDLANMFQWMEENNASFMARRDLVLSKKLNPELLNHRTWLFIHGKDIPM
jgi:hypothetical protein